MARPMSEPVTRGLSCESDYCRAYALQGLQLYLVFTQNTEQVEVSKKLTVPLHAVSLLPLLFLAAKIRSTIMGLPNREVFWKHKQIHEQSRHQRL